MFLKFVRQGKFAVLRTVANLRPVLGFSEGGPQSAGKGEGRSWVSGCVWDTEGL